jgi:two-component system, sensor histidine kinase and response regulator
MDLQMPEMDGFEATTAIRAREAKEKHTPIIAVTAHHEEEFIARAHAVGMDGHLPKPIEREALRAVIDQWISAIQAAPAPTTGSAAVVR